MVRIWSPVTLLDLAYRVWEPLFEGTLNDSVRLFPGPHVAWLNRIESVLQPPEANDVRSLFAVAHGPADLAMEAAVTNESTFPRVLRLVTEPPSAVSFGEGGPRAGYQLKFEAPSQPLELTAGQSVRWPLTGRLAAVRQPPAEDVSLAQIRSEFEFLHRAQDLLRLLRHPIHVQLSIDGGDGEVRAYPLTLRVTRGLEALDGLTEQHLERYEQVATEGDGLEAYLRAAARVGTQSYRAGGVWGVGRLVLSLQADAAGWGDGQTDELLDGFALTRDQLTGCAWSAEAGRVVVTWSAEPGVLEPAVRGITSAAASSRPAANPRVVAATWEFTGGTEATVEFSTSTVSGQNTP